MGNGCSFCATGGSGGGGRGAQGAQGGPGAQGGAGAQGAQGASGGGSSAVSWEAMMVARAKVALGLTDGEFAVDYKDWLDSDAGWTFDIVSAGVGGFSFAQAKSGGLTLSGAAGKFSLMSRGDSPITSAAGTPSPVGRADGSGGAIWHIACRIRVPSSNTLTAASFLGLMGLTNAGGGTTFVRVEISPFFSAVNFTLRLIGGAAVAHDTGIPFALDSTYDCELWCDGTNFKVRINNGTPFSTSVAGMTTDWVGPQLQSQDGANAYSATYYKTVTTTPVPALGS